MRRSWARWRAVGLLTAPLLALGLTQGACRERKSKEELYARSEQQIVRKMEALRQRRQEIDEKLEDLEGRLAAVRGRLRQLRQSWAEPTPTPPATRVPTAAL
jgi:hypothetical protein